MVDSSKKRRNQVSEEDNTFVTSIRIDKELHARATRKAKMEQRSFNGYAVNLVIADLARAGAK